MARDFNTVGVVGLGTMGAGIVEVFARSGLDVVAIEMVEMAIVEEVEMVLVGDLPGGTLKATGMAAAWVINLAVGEWLVRRSQGRSGRGRSSTGQSRRRV